MLTLFSKSKLDQIKNAKLCFLFRKHCYCELHRICHTDTGTRVPSFSDYYHKCVDMWPKSNAKVLAWRKDSEWTCSHSQNGQNDRNLTDLGPEQKKNILTEKSRVSDSNVGEVGGRVGVDEAFVDCLGAEGVNHKQSTRRVSLWVVESTPRGVYAEFITVFWFGRRDPFFDWFFQYQSWGIDPYIFFKFFVQFGHVAWEFRGNSTKMMVCVSPFVSACVSASLSA